MPAPWTSMKPTSGGGSELPPAGNHPAVLVALIDLGTHAQTYNEGKENQKTADVRRVFIIWELTQEKMSGMKDTNHIIGKDYNVNFAETGALRKMVEGWRGKKFSNDELFNLDVLLGRPCLVNIKHGQTEKTKREYANLDGVTNLPKGMPVPVAQRNPVQWLVENGDPKDLDWCPWIFGEKIADIVARSHEVKAKPAAAPAPAPPLPPVPSTNNNAWPAAAQQPTPAMTGTEVDEIPF